MYRTEPLRWTQWVYWSEPLRWTQCVYRGSLPYTHCVHLRGSLSTDITFLMFPRKPSAKDHCHQVQGSEGSPTPSPTNPAHLLHIWGPWAPTPSRWFKIKRRRNLRLVFRRKSLRQMFESWNIRDCLFCGLKMVKGNFMWYNLMSRQNRHSGLKFHCDDGCRAQ